jgi:hypothetical protein
MGWCTASPARSARSGGGRAGRRRDARAGGRVADVDLVEVARTHRCGRVHGPRPGEPRAPAARGRHGSDAAASAPVTASEPQGPRARRARRRAGPAGVAGYEQLGGDSERPASSAATGATVERSAALSRPGGERWVSTSSLAITAKPDRTEQAHRRCQAAGQRLAVVTRGEDVALGGRGELVAASCSHWGAGADLVEVAHRAHARIAVARAEDRAVGNPQPPYGADANLQPRTMSSSRPCSTSRSSAGDHCLTSTRC